MVSSLAPTRSEALWERRGLGLPFLYRKHAPSILYGFEKSTSPLRASVIVMEAMAKSAVPALSRGRMSENSTASTTSSRPAFAAILRARSTSEPMISPDSLL